MTSVAEDGTANQDELRLEATAGKATGFSFVVRDRLVIGRGSDGPGRLADDPELSRHHAEIAREPNGEFTITDLSSTNGTFVNGTRLQAAAVLRSGDEIEVGGTTLAVLSAPVVAEPAAAEVDVRAATMEAPLEVPEPPVQHPGNRPFEVRLVVDFEEEEAELSVYGRGEPIRLELDGGQWRVRNEGS